jgi:hypothetical protein
MSEQTLIISDIFESDDSHKAIAANFSDFDLRHFFAQKSFDEIKADFLNKSCLIVGEGVQFKTKIIDVEVNSSLAGFKNIFFKIPHSSYFQKIRIHDQVRIES